MDVQSLIETFGYVAIFTCVFIECGFFLGLILPLPGFSILFTASVFAASGQLDLSTIVTTGIIAAILGYISGYLTGRYYGRKLLYEKSTKRFFTEKQGKQTERFMKRYGYSTLIIGRFLPVMHSLAPILSGIARMPILPFMAANVSGGIIWVMAASYSGYYLGQSVPYAQYLAIPFVVAIAVFLHSKAGRRLLRDVGKWYEEV